MRRPASIAAAALIAGALLAIALAGTLSGCGLKGPLYLPSQKKTKVPATPTHPAPDTPAPAPASASGAG